ncbi:MAG TPA: cupin domain-containing protein [Caulobacteraceae bacterium]|nr:cupin domain-containing protein [Caulobacteraceae bacterium]
MRKIDIKSLPVRRGSGYPSPHNEPVAARERRPLCRTAGLTEFGVNLLTLKPGVWSSQRHWHSHADEFVFGVSGEVVLVTDAGEEVLRAGECAAFKAGDPDGHHLINRSDADAVVLEIGNNDPARDRTVYSDIDMVLEPGEGPPRHKDGTPYPAP